MTEYNVTISCQTNIKNSLINYGILHGRVEINDDILQGIKIACNLLFYDQAFRYINIVAKGDVIDINDGILKQEGNKSIVLSKEILKILPNNSKIVPSILYSKSCMDYVSHITIRSETIILQSNSLDFFRGINTILELYYVEGNTCYIKDYYLTKEKKYMNENIQGNINKNIYDSDSDENK